MDGPERLAAMITLSRKWSLYRYARLFFASAITLYLINLESFALNLCHLTLFSQSVYILRLHNYNLQCREDAELKTALKLVSFIPLWDSSGTDQDGEQGEEEGERCASISTGSAASTVPNSLYNSLDITAPSSSSPPISYRRPDELLSWGNIKLLEALKGQQQSRLVLGSCIALMFRSSAL